MAPRLLSSSIKTPNAAGCHAGRIGMAGPSGHRLLQRAAAQARPEPLRSTPSSRPCTSDPSFKAPNDADGRRALRPRGWACRNFAVIYIRLIRHKRIFRVRGPPFLLVFVGLRRICGALHGIHNPKVGSSSLPPATNAFKRLRSPAWVAVSRLVTHLRRRFPIRLLSTSLRAFRSPALAGTSWPSRPPASCLPLP